MEEPLVRQLSGKYRTDDHAFPAFVREKT